MAQKHKRPSPLEDPPTASSSDSEEDQQPSSQQHHQEEEEDEEEDDEEGEGSSEEQEDDDDEEDQDQPSSQPASSPSAKVKIPPPNSTPKPAASSDSDSDSSSESDQPPPSSKVKPLASKPIDPTPKSKPHASASAASRSTAKRPLDNNGHVPDPKRAKKKETDSAASDDEAEEDAKKPGDESKKLFQRVWSEDDEIAILKGMIEFSSKTGADPYKHADALHDFLKKTQSLRVDASTNQLKQKVRRLKSKFENNAGKGKNGEGPKFSKPHEQKSFELSKKIWGNTADAAAGANGPVEMPKTNNGKGAKSPKQDTKSNPKPEPRSKPKSEPVAVDSKEAGKMDIDEKIDTTLHLLEVTRLDKGMGMYGLNEDVVKRGLELMGSSGRAELEEQWKKLQVAELELYVKRAEVVANQARLILEAYRSSNH